MGSRAWVALWAALAVGCTEQSMAKQVPVDLGAQDASVRCSSSIPTCPTTPPSYQNQVAPIINQYCVPCHGPGGVTANMPLDSYSDVFADKQAVLDQFYECMMPPADAGQPSEAQRAELLTWLVCKAPNN